MSARWLLTAAFGVVLANVAIGDWPQWRGPDRNAHTADFKAPATWPKELTKKWKITVGDGVATPALVGDRLFIFSRESGGEVTRCVTITDGKEVWKDKYDAGFRGGADSGFTGPRCSPAVVGGKVVTMGVNGTLSCLDAEKGTKLWRKETGTTPRFHTSSSPMMVDDVVIAQFGSEQNGGVAAYKLADGNEKWKWSAEGTGYASPVLMTVDGTKMVVAETNSSVVGLDLKDGKLLWKTPFPITGARGYNASTPIVEGQTIIFSGSSRGTRAVKIEKSGDTFSAKEVWNNKDNSVIYNTPVVHKKVVYGMTSANKLFSINAESGKTGWTADAKGRGGYGSIVHAGNVLVSLTTAAQLVIYEPTEKEFKELASYKVADSDTYAYPILSGNRVFIKDKDSVILWSVE